MKVEEKVRTLSVDEHGESMDWSRVWLVTCMSMEEDSCLGGIEVKECEKYVVEPCLEKDRNGMSILVIVSHCVDKCLEKGSNKA